MTDEQTNGGEAKILQFDGPTQLGGEAALRAAIAFLQQEVVDLRRRKATLVREKGTLVTRIAELEEEVTSLKDAAWTRDRNESMLTVGVDLNQVTLSATPQGAYIVKPNARPQSVAAERSPKRWWWTKHPSSR